MSGCHLYLAANFHCPSAGQRKTDRQADIRYGRRGRTCFVFLGKSISGKRGKLARQRRKREKIKQQQTVPANSLRNKEKQKQPNEGGV